MRVTAYEVCISSPGVPEAGLPAITRVFKVCRDRKQAECAVAKMIADPNGPLSTPWIRESSYFGGRY